MNKFDNLFPNILYHSYVIEGNPDSTPFLLKQFFEKRDDLQIDTQNIFFQIYDSLTVDDSSQLKEWHSLASSDSGKNICIIGAKFINHDAERTLLKMIEEPTSNTHFFIIVPNSKVLLDTILSRVHIVKINEDDDIEIQKNVEEFIKSNSKGRLDMVVQIIDNHKDDNGSGGIRFKAIKFVNNLERIVHNEWKSNKEDKNLELSLSELSKARDYLGTPGASVKMILEHIALVL